MKLPPEVNFINILWAAFVPISFWKKSQWQIVIREELRRVLLYKKDDSKMLMKLTPGKIQVDEVFSSHPVVQLVGSSGLLPLCQSHGLWTLFAYMVNIFEDPRADPYRDYLKFWSFNVHLQSVKQIYTRFFDLLLHFFCKN